MWKQRTDSADTPNPTTTPEAAPAVTERPQATKPSAQAAPAVTSSPPAPAAKTPAPAASNAASATLGRSVVIKGGLTSEEDLTIDGRVEGTIETKQYSVLVGQQATVNAQIFAKHVVVLGKVRGDITAGTKVEIRAEGTVEGDLISPAVAIAEGATFRGSIDMSKKQASAESAA